jgi:FkbM family methyltransferase
MFDIKYLLRKSLHFYCTSFPLRGRYSLANHLGSLIATGHEDHLLISGMRIPMDHSLAMYRYIYYGLYEEDFIRFLNRVIREGDVIIEPGTNIGYITSVLSGLVGDKGKVITLEPSRICFSKVQHYLSAPNIILLHKALIDEGKNVSFTDKPIVIQHGYSAISELTTKDPKDNVYDIPGISVDSLIESYNLQNVRLLKLDIEGSEYKALKGAENALSRNVIDYILVESLFDEENKEVNELISEQLSRHGYKPYLMKRNRIQSVQLSDLSGKRLDLIWSHLNS